MYHLYQTSRRGGERDSAHSLGHNFGGNNGERDRDIKTAVMTPKEREGRGNKQLQRSEEEHRDPHPICVTSGPQEEQLQQDTARHAAIGSSETQATKAPPAWCMSQKRWTEWSAAEL